MSHDIALVAFTVLMTLGILVGVSWWRTDDAPFPEHDPRRILRLVHRDDRAAYRRIMRRTMVVQMRDLSRSFAVLSRQIGKALLPAVRAVADAVRTWKP